MNAIAFWLRFGKEPPTPSRGGNKSAGGSVCCRAIICDPNRLMAERPLVIIRTEPEGSLLTVKGQDAWALLELIKAGDDGIAPLDTPGPRWSGYVHQLRKAGLVIATIYESHLGPFPGTHARFVLRSEVIVMPDRLDAA